MTFQEVYAQFQEDLTMAQTGQSGTITKRKGLTFIQSELSSTGVRSYQVDLSKLEIEATIVRRQDGKLIHEHFTLEAKTNQLVNHQAKKSAEKAA